MNTIDLSNATPAQTAAVMTTATNNLVLAGPGSGKTRTLVWRILHLIETGVEPAQICCVTFTNDAAHEVGKRVRDAKPGVRLGYLGTLHGWCLKLLQRYGSPLGYTDRIAVLDAEQADALLLECAVAAGAKKLTLKALQARRAEIVGMEARRMSDPAAVVVMSYFRKLRGMSAVDFETLLEDALALLRCSQHQRPAYAHLLVDEYQDSGKLDHAIYDEFPAACHYLVGDPDQAIYSFRGGRLQNILDVARNGNFAKHVLDLNFRSCPLICGLAQNLIEHNTARFAKATISAVSETRQTDALRFLPYLSEGQEATDTAKSILADIHDRGISPDEIAVLARTNAIANLMARTAVEMGVPVRQKKRQNAATELRGMKPFVDVLISPSDLAVAAYARERFGDAEAEAMAKRAALGQGTLRGQVQDLPDGRTIKTRDDLGTALARMGLNMTAIEAVLTAWDSIEEPTLPELAFALAQNQGHTEEIGDGVTITTFHGAKGREWDLVYIVGCEQEVMPGTAKSRDVEEERRIAYVGVTRARWQLTISQAMTRPQPWGDKRAVKTQASQFLREMGIRGFNP